MWEAGSALSGKTMSSYVTAASARKIGSEYSSYVGSPSLNQPQSPVRQVVKSNYQRPISGVSYGIADNRFVDSSIEFGSPRPSSSKKVQPTNEQLLIETKRILETADLMTLTKKQIRDELSTMFGVDLKQRKEELNQMIDNILQG